MKLIELEKLNRIISNLFNKIKSTFATKNELATGLNSKANKTHDHESITGNAGTATKLKNSIQIGEADFDGSSSISFNSIVQYTDTTTSASDKANLYTRFATVDVSKGPYTLCTGQIIFSCAEANRFSGILQFYFRTGETVQDTSVNLEWLSLINLGYEGSVIAEKTRDGVFELYFRPRDTWTIARMMCITNNDDKITFHKGLGYASSVNAFVTSTIANMASSSKQLVSSTNVGSSTQPVYFSNGLPVVCKPYYSLTAVGDSGWSQVEHYSPITVSTLSYWNGAYDGGTSNLAYCKHGAFGSIVTKNSGDYYSSGSRGINVQHISGSAQGDYGFGSTQRSIGFIGVYTGWSTNTLYINTYNSGNGGESASYENVKIKGNLRPDNLFITGKRIAIQSSAPTGFGTGDVWIQI